MIEIGQISINENDVEYANNQITLKVNNGEFQKGSIALTNQEIAWKKENTNEGFSIPWGKIVVTAISQSPRSIYFMIDSKWIDDESSESSEMPANGNGDHANEDDNEEEEGEDAESGQDITEFWLVPEQPSDIDNLYFFMSKYPAADDNMDGSEEEGDDEFFDGEDMEQMNINDDDQRFAD